MPPQSPTQQLLIPNNSSGSNFSNNLINQPSSPSQINNNNNSNTHNSQSNSSQINNNSSSNQNYMNENFQMVSSSPNSSNLIQQGQSPSQQTVNFHNQNFQITNSSNNFQQQMSVNHVSNQLLPTNITQQIMVSHQQIPQHLHMQQQRMCSSCNSSIRDRYLLQCLDRFWHVQCLKCQICKVTLSDLGEKCFTRDQMILCRNDYFKMYGGRCIGGKCDSCLKPILGNEQVMRAFNSVYHVDCFNCQICRIKLKTGDKFCYSNGRIFCEKDNPSIANISSQLNHQIITNGGNRQNLIHSTPIIGVSTQIISQTNNLVGSSSNNIGNKRSNNSGAKRSKGAKTSQQQQQQQQQQQLLNQQQINIHQQQMNLQHQQQLIFQDDQQIQMHQQIIN